jgi:hypothetical protein
VENVQITIIMQTAAVLGKKQVVFVVFHDGIAKFYWREAASHGHRYECHKGELMGADDTVLNNQFKFVPAWRDNGNPTEGRPVVGKLFKIDEIDEASKRLIADQRI